MPPAPVPPALGRLARARWPALVRRRSAPARVASRRGVVIPAVWRLARARVVSGTAAWHTATGLPGGPGRAAKTTAGIGVILTQPASAAGLTRTRYD